MIIIQEITARISASKDYIRVLFKTAWVEYVKSPTKKQNFVRFTTAIRDAITVKKTEIRIKKEFDAKAEEERKNTILGRLLG